MGVYVPENEPAESTSTRNANGHAISGSDKVQGGPGLRELSRTQQDKEEEFATKTKWVDTQQKGRFETQFGRLVVNQGKSRYINSSFFANLSDEVEDLKGILHQTSDEEDMPSPGIPTQTQSNHNGFVFGFSSQNVDMLSLHPLSDQIAEYWAVYKDR
jgi:hypothetical protein